MARHHLLALFITGFLASTAAATTGDFRDTFRSQSRQDRHALQSALAEVGLYHAGIDGLWGPGTARAIAAARGSLGYAPFLAEARDAGLTDEFAVLLLYVRSPILTATLATRR